MDGHAFRDARSGTPEGVIDLSFSYYVNVTHAKIFHLSAVTSKSERACAIFLWHAAITAASVLTWSQSTRAFNIGEFIEDRPQQPIPKSLQGYECELLEFETRCRRTCHRILRLLALGLEVSTPNHFLTSLLHLHFRTS